MLRKVGKSPEMKIRATTQEKAIFAKAAETKRQSLNQWVIGACLEQATRDGITDKKGNGR